MQVLLWILHHFSTLYDLVHSYPLRCKSSKKTRRKTASFIFQTGENDVVKQLGFTEIDESVAVGAGFAFVSAVRPSLWGQFAETKFRCC